MLRETLTWGLKQRLKQRYLLVSESGVLWRMITDVVIIITLCNLVPRAHVPFGQRQDTELWNNPF